jgi:nitrite transporter NirC
MYKTDIQKLSQAAVKKVQVMNETPLSYLILSAFAGIYVAFGIGLIFAFGAPMAAAGSPFLKLAMSASFGIALTLVIFAGSELFTGNNMFGVIGAMTGEISWASVLRLWLWCYVGNLLGSLLLAWLFVQSGVFNAAPHSEFIQKAVAAKMNAPLWPLFVRGILANWLVCLSVWMAARTQSESAKIVLIYMCLMAFIAPGFEHSVANMSLLAMGLFQAHGAAISWFGYVRNLIPATLGNIVGGGLFVGGLYWFVSQPALEPQPSILERAEQIALER